LSGKVSRFTVQQTLDFWSRMPVVGWVHILLSICYRDLWALVGFDEGDIFFEYDEFIIVILFPFIFYSF